LNPYPKEKYHDRMNLFTSMGLASTIALALPIITLIISRLGWYRSLLALLAYYAIALTYNLITLGYVNISKESAFYFGTVANLLDAPLILLFLSYFSKTASYRKKLITLTYCFIGFEIIVLVIYGFSVKTSTVILAPGLAVILVLSILFFIHQVKIAVVYQKAVGKAIMITSLLVAYAGYAFVYAVYYLIEQPYKNDARLIFYLITIITSIPMAIGVFFERKRVRHLAELRTTRKELKAIYGEDNTAPSVPPSLDAIVFNMDNEKWN
jgi:hypothetical protein